MPLLLVGSDRNPIIKSPSAVAPSAYECRGCRSSKVAAMATEQIQDAAAVRAGRERYVTRGVATTDMTVSRAEGATIWDADGRAYLDFAGGIACQNLGHNPDEVVQAIHAQAARH